MRICIISSVFLCALASQAFASSSSAADSAPGKIYIGAFGGGGSSNNFNANQLGTAFFTEAEGGPLSVNAFGQLDSQSTSFFGAQLGYMPQQIMLGSSSRWTLGPAVELEGYSMRDNTFDGSFNNNTARLSEHDFIDSYPMSRTIFLANAVLSFNHPRLVVHPYIGAGIGSAIIRITDATSTQVNPAEAGVNHYNTNTNDTDSAFAGQVKLGLSYDINNYLSVFAEYRWLYIASTSFVFGSTVYPGHAETSSWQVAMDAQRYNLGNLGIRVKF